MNGKGEQNTANLAMVLLQAQSALKMNLQIAPVIQERATYYEMSWNSAGEWQLAIERHGQWKRFNGRGLNDFADLDGLFREKQENPQIELQLEPTLQSKEVPF